MTENLVNNFKGLSFIRQVEASLYW